jgi:hypothetical protein
MSPQVENLLEAHAALSKTLEECQAERDALAAKLSATGLTLTEPELLAMTKEPAMEWLPIESAPKDGWFLIHIAWSSQHPVAIGRRGTGSSQYNWDWIDLNYLHRPEALINATDEDPEGWMPLPAPPKGAV